MKKLPLTLIVVMALAVCGTVTQAQTKTLTMKSKETSLQNWSVVYEQPEKEAVGDFSQSADDMCVGRGVRAYDETMHCDGSSFTYIEIDVYETNNACGNYYAIYDQERYKVLQGEKERCGHTYRYYITRKGRHYWFNL